MNFGLLMCCLRLAKQPNGEIDRDATLAQQIQSSTAAALFECGAVDARINRCAVNDQSTRASIAAVVLQPPPVQISASAVGA